MAISRISRIQPASTRRTPRSRGLRSLGGDWPDFRPPGPTATQLFEIAMAKQMKRHSFMDKVQHAGSTAFSGGWHGLEWTFDKMLRPTYAFATALKQETKDARQGHPTGLLGMLREHDFTDLRKSSHAFVAGLKGHEHTTYSDVLKDYSFFRKHNKTRFAAGFIGDVALDPTTYISGGTTAVAKTAGETAAHVAGRAALEGKALSGTGKAVKGAAAGAKWRKVERTIETGGKDYKWRAALAKERARHADLGKKLTAGDRAELRVVAEAAKREEFATSKHLPYLRFGTHKDSYRTPTSIGGKNIVPHIPSVGSIAEHIPVVRGAVGFLRHAVGPGKGDIVRGIRVSTKHTMEELSSEYLHFTRTMVEKLPRLETERAVRTLSKFEKKGGVKKVVDEKGNVDYVLNEKRIDRLTREGKINEDDISLLRGWHDIAQQMHRYDKAFGIKYAHMGEQGRLYVPHLMDRIGQPYTIAQKNMLKQQGYTKGRGKYLSLEHIHNLHKEGKLPRAIETDPYKMIVSMARARAHQHSDAMAVNVLKRGFGVGRRIVDKPAQRKIEKTQARIDAIDATLERFNTPSLKNLKQVKNWTKERTQLEADMVKLRKGKKNKAFSNDMVDLKDLRDEFGNKVGIEPELAHALTRYEKIVDPTDDVAITQFSRGWASMVGRWKLLVTAVNPGYRIRNTLSDFWNMYISGVPTWAFGRYGARAAKVMMDAKKGTGAAGLEAQKILSDAYKAGILSGLFGGDIDTLALMLKYGGSKRSLAKEKKFIRLSSKIAQDINRNGENWGRLVHYLYRREHEHMSIEDAAWEVKKAHFDYEDLTEFERQKLKGSLIPFYTWTRKNIPYQLQAMVTHPGKYAAFPKFATESEKAAGGDTGTVLPDYMTSNMSFQIPLGKHTYTTPQLGMGDLARFFENRDTAIQSGLSMLNPAFKTPIEIGMNKSMYTGQPLHDPAGHPRQPISDWAAPFISLIPGSNVGPTARQTGKGRVEGAGAAWWVNYAFGQTPWTRALFLGGKIKHQQRGFSPWWGQLGGVSITRIDPEQQAIIERLALKDKLKGRMKGLRDEGRFPQAEAKKQSEYERYIQRLIAKNMGRQ